MDNITAKLDEMGKPAWIGLMVLSFVLFWPLGLALLAFLIWSGRMGCRKHRAGRWRFEENAESFRDRGWFGQRRTESSGNRAFDEYREETLRRLEEEQKDFHSFLDRLRFAKDKAEFDEFLAERRRGKPSEEPQAGPA